MKMLGIAGWKNSGKTTLAASLVAELAKQGLVVSTIKHAHHNFEIDQPGTDSYRHRKAGAEEVLIVSSKRWALIHEENKVVKPDLMNMAKKLGKADLVLVEGFKTFPIPKLEVRRKVSSGPPLAPNDANIIAIASDETVTDNHMPIFDLEDIKGIADFVIKRFGLKSVNTKIHH